jgi:hypothetical protein
MEMDYIWAIFVAEGTGGFPNFYPIGVYTLRERAVENLKELPKDKNYQLLRLPINAMFPYYHKKSGKLIGMNAIHHEHYHYKDDEA